MKRIALLLTTLGILLFGMSAPAAASNDNVAYPPTPSTTVPEDTTTTTVPGKATTTTVTAGGQIPTTGSSGINSSLAIAGILLAVGVGLVIVTQVRRRGNAAS